MNASGSGFRAVLFWTELKLLFIPPERTAGFRAVLFWTELKQEMSKFITIDRFRAVLFWTELKPKSHVSRLGKVF